MIIVEFSQDCKQKLEKAKRENPRLFQKIRKQLVFFQQNPNHPSLRLHKLSGSKLDTWSISVDMSYRLLFYYRKTKTQMRAVFFDFGKHEEVYK